MKNLRGVVLGVLAGLLALGAIGCSPVESEREDVRDAQEKLDEEKQDLASED